ncbi:MAG: NAD(P)H:quinone oxidoreductase [Myxococcota bacterium]
MTQVLVLYYSASGHVEAMANAVAEGARKAGAQVSLKRVPDLVRADGSGREDGSPGATAPVASIEELPSYDAIVFGTPTRFGNMAAPMKAFLDRAAGLWSQDSLVGKVGSAFTSTGSQHGGQESTLLAFHQSLLHLGMVVVGLPYTWKGQLREDEITGGSPYGAATMAGGNGARQPSANELEGARFQGSHVAEIAAKLAA